ncbi:MAG: hypothetical protein ABMA00_06840, partial [Gemmatimonas sp.]
MMMRQLLSSSGVTPWLLPTMVLWPLAAAAIVRVAGRDASREESVGAAPTDGIDARVLTLAALTLEALLGVALWCLTDPDIGGWQFRVDVPWLTDIGATFSLGVDGLS